MVLPFDPMTMTFRDLHYYVPIPKVTVAIPSLHVCPSPFPAKRPALQVEPGCPYVTCAIISGAPTASWHCTCTALQHHLGDLQSKANRCGISGTYTI